MKSIIKYLITVNTVILFGCNTAVHSSDELELNKSTAVITGEFIHAGSGNTEVSINFRDELPFSREIGNINSKIEVDHKGNFVYKTPELSGPTRINIVVPRKRTGDINNHYRDALRSFIIEPGDSIHLAINTHGEETSYVFSGRGSDKFEAQWKLGLIAFNALEHTLENKAKIMYSWPPLKRYKTYFAIADSVISEQIKVLESYRNTLNTELYQLIKANAIATTYLYLKGMWDLQPEKLNTDEIEQLKQLVQSSMQLNVEDKVLASSLPYIQFVSQQTVAKLILDHPRDTDYDFLNIYSAKFNELCSVWRNEYSGLLREKLLLYNLQKIGVQDTRGMESCLRETYPLIKTPQLKRVMDEVYGKKIRGAKAYNFNLPNTDGQLVKLEDFKGKVVYLDIWFTGCSACMALANEVDHKVYPEFKSNKDIVFISISLDKSKERWLKSVASEKYGLKEYINLYTEGLGLDHPFTKYYNIRGGPVTMIIDRDGKIYSSTPPKYGHMPELIELINEALEQ